MNPSDDAWYSMLMPLADLVIDPDFQARVKGVDKDRVAHYADCMKRGDKFPPIKVGSIEGKLYVLEGFHRIEAAAKIGRLRIEAEVKVMSRAEAMMIAGSSNQHHGLWLNRDDRRRANALLVAGAIKAGLHREGKSVGEAKSFRELEKEFRAMGSVISHTTIGRILKANHRGVYDKYYCRSFFGGGGCNPPKISDEERLGRLKSRLSLLSAEIAHSGDR
jgi:hypothetical protein